MSDTFAFVQAGMAAFPGTCLICGYDKRDMIDTKREVEYYGAILFCVECINDMGTVPQLNFVSRIELEESKALVNSLSELVQQYETLRRNLEDGLVRVASDFNIEFDRMGILRNNAVSEPQIRPVSATVAERKLPTYDSSSF